MNEEITHLIENKFQQEQRCVLFGEGGGGGGGEGGGGRSGELVGSICDPHEALGRVIY